MVSRELPEDRQHPLRGTDGLFHGASRSSELQGHSLPGRSPPFRGTSGSFHGRSGSFQSSPTGSRGPRSSGRAADGLLHGAGDSGKSPRRVDILRDSIYVRLTPRYPSWHTRHLQRARPLDSARSLNEHCGSLKIEATGSEGVAPLDSVLPFFLGPALGTAGPCLFWLLDLDAAIRPIAATPAT